MEKNLETNRIRIIRGSKETFNLKDTKAKRERTKKRSLEENRDNSGNKKVNNNIIS